MPDYLLSVHHADTDPAPDHDEMQRRFREVGAFNEALMASGQFVHAGGLMPPSTARVHDAAAGTSTPGTRTPGGVQLGGFWVVQADDDAAADDLGRRASAATGAPVEVRPFQGI